MLCAAIMGLSSEQRLKLVDYIRSGASDEDVDPREFAAGLGAWPAASAWAVVAAVETTAELCCCHNDLVAENIVSADGVTFLDFEYASDNDPLFDLAIVVEHHSLSDIAESRLLDAYFGADASDQRAELAAQRRVYAALSWLWDKSRP